MITVTWTDEQVVALTEILSVSADDRAVELLQVLAGAQTPAEPKRYTFTLEPGSISGRVKPLGKKGN